MVKLGLKENWQQFSILVLVNMMVGGMVGLERTIVPLIGTQEFLIDSNVVVFSFIIAFGVVKAFTNLISGALADKFTRKKSAHLGLADRFTCTLFNSFWPLLELDTFR